MVGKYSIRIYNKKVRYDLSIKRKYTVIRGSSATGKTYLRDLLESGSANVECKVDVLALPKSKFLYSSILKDKSNSIIVIDEDVDGINTSEFADLLKSSDNYFILFTREKLAYLPISVEEIYKFKNTTKYNNLEKAYTVTTLDSYFESIDKRFIPDLVIVEDSKSGFEFFSSVLSVPCITAGGNSNIYSKLVNISRSGVYKNICIIVDGAAFGSFVEEVLDLIRNISVNVVLLAPESFEYLLLRSGCVSCNSLVLFETFNYCDIDHFSKECPNFSLGSNTLQSWEQLYTAYIKYLTRDSKEIYYSKGKLNPYYLRFSNKVLELLPDSYIEK